MSYGNSEITSEQIDLGKRLFNEIKLSSDGKQSCASCHMKEHAFTDGKKLGLNSNRNTPSILNSIYSDRYFYDLRADGLADQISKHSITHSLSTYIASKTTHDSAFEQYVLGQTDRMKASVKRGYNLFMGRAACGTCHFAPTFSGLVPPNFKEMESEVLGVPSSSNLVDDGSSVTLNKDLGRYSGINKDRLDIYKNSFKTVGLKNVADTAPYMHNGVYKTLEEVMDFYNQGGGAGMGLDVPHQTLSNEPLNLSSQEIEDIIEFLKSI